jgi:hypothetical protein
MLITDVEPIIGAFPNFRNEKEFDAWDMLDTIFEHYRLDEIREALWDMYKAALQDNTTYSNRQQLNNLVFFFENLNDLATASYVIAKEKFSKTEERKDETYS